MKSYRSYKVIAIVSVTTYKEKTSDIRKSTIKYRCTYLCLILLCWWLIILDARQWHYRHQVEQRQELESDSLINCSQTIDWSADNQSQNHYTNQHLISNLIGQSWKQWLACETKPSEKSNQPKYISWGYTLNMIMGRLWCDVPQLFVYIYHLFGLKAKWRQ